MGCTSRLTNSTTNSCNASHSLLSWAKRTSILTSHASRKASPALVNGPAMAPGIREVRQPAIAVLTEAAGTVEGMEGMEAVEAVEAVEVRAMAGKMLVPEPAAEARRRLSGRLPLRTRRR